MKLDKSNGPRPGVALATVAAALTVAIGITIGALASYASPTEGSNSESSQAAEAEAPRASPVVEEAAVMEAQPSPAAEGDAAPTAKRRDKRERKHERREHHREEDDDDD